MSEVCVHFPKSQKLGHLIWLIITWSNLRTFSWSLGTVINNCWTKMVYLLTNIITLTRNLVAIYNWWERGAGLFSQTLMQTNTHVLTCFWMWHHRSQVYHQMSCTVRNASRREYECSLLVFPSRLQGKNRTNIEWWPMTYDIITIAG